MDEIQKAPDVIYLQWLDEDGDKNEDTTWCVDRIYETDTEYVPKAALDAAEQRAEIADEKRLVAEQYGQQRAKVAAEAEQRAAEAEGLLAECKNKMQAAITPEWCKDDRGDYCPSCNNYDRNGHDNDCPRQAAAEWLEVHGG